MRVLLSRAWSNDQHLPAVAGPWCSSWVIYCAFLLICDTIHLLLAFVSALSTSAGPTASCSHLTMVRTIMLETVRNFLSTPALRLRGQPPGLQCLLSFSTVARRFLLCRCVVPRPQGQRKVQGRQGGSEGRGQGEPLSPAGGPLDIRSVQGSLWCFPKGCTHSQACKAASYTR